MPTMFFCLLLTMFLPYIPRIFVAKAQYDKGYNNREPRRQQATLTGIGQRAQAAHQNSFEALILFTAAVVLAYVTQVDPSTAGQISIAFVIARVIYIALYLLDLPAARTTIWIIGFGLTFILACGKWIF